MNSIKSNLFSAVKYYIKLSHELQASLFKHPEDYPKFQGIFNLSVDKVYQDIQQFERENIDKFESRVYKMKKIFEKRYRRYFLHGEFIRRSFEKPFGYAGDFQIIDSIYKNQSRTNGFDRLWDNYFQDLAIAKATRERNEDFKKIILDLVRKNRNQGVRIMNLACGSAREIKELLDGDYDKVFTKVTFDCCDFDTRAIDYAKQLLNNPNNVNFFQKNAIRLALKKDIKQELPKDYDLIYSTGLSDYLDESIASRLMGNLKRALKKGGMLAIANVRDKYSNSSASWMEWVADWNLIYRTEAEFKKIFLNAGFLSPNLQIIPQQSKVMQYRLARSEN